MHACPNCGSDCDCDRGLPGCEHLCIGAAMTMESVYVVNPIDDRIIHFNNSGMMLRDYFAAQAMSLARWTTGESIGTYEQNIAAKAYALADAMLAERDK